MFLSDFFFFCQSTATVLILRYCLMNTAVTAKSLFKYTAGLRIQTLHPDQDREEILFLPEPVYSVGNAADIVPEGSAPVLRAPL